MSHDESDVRILDQATGLPPTPGPPGKRSNRRYVIQLHVTLQSEHNFYQGFSENISEGGLFIATHQTMPIGTQIMLQFALPNTTVPLIIPGEVRWVRDPRASAHPGMGVRFVEADDESVRAIQEFIRLRDPEFYED